MLEKLATKKANEGELLEPQIEVVENGQSKVENIESDEHKVFEEKHINEEKACTTENDAIKVLQNDIAKLNEQINGLTKLFEKRIAYTEQEKEIIDNMHKELQEHRKDLYSQIVRPILLDLITMRKSILRVSSAFQNKPEGEQNIPLKTFESYATEIEGILKRNSIEIYKSEVGTDFVPIRQRMLEQVPTADESLHGKIAESTSDGYEYMGNTIDPENVAIYVLKLE